MLIHRGWSRYVDRLRDELLQNRPQIHVVNFDFYDTGIIKRCESGNNLLLAIPDWVNVHPLLEVIPVEWDFTIPFELLYSPQPAETVKYFLCCGKSSGKAMI